MVSPTRTTSELEELLDDLPGGEGLDLEDEDEGEDDGDPVEGRGLKEDNEHIIQGLSQIQLQVLAQKVYDLLLDELRIEQERYGGGGLR